MDYEYRNVDTDIELLKAAKMYWEEGATKQDVYDMLANKCYTPWEADRALNDYYYIYVNSPNLLKYTIIASCINVIFLVTCYWIGVLIK
jgi:predicted component of type VI protein secretion system